jgi:hydroxymethylpyrimidine pyrophosphatase-like HAD family hydrolase
MSMDFIALAADYDGTIAHDERVDSATYEALARFKESGRRLLLVTGREFSDLKRVFPGYELFDRIVAENGALIYDPARKQERLIGEAPPADFIAALRNRRVEPLSVGKCIAATWQPHETTVLEVIREFGLELQIILNKGAVMILPAGVNKASGLQAALDDLELSPRNVVAVGDAENDLAFLTICGCSAAVANALPSVKRSVDLVLRQERGAGVAELIDKICGEGLAASADGCAHTRYAEGELGAERSFYFRGPNCALNLRAQNLTVFVQLAAEIDDGAWEFHRHAGDYSNWFRTTIEDGDLADEAAKIEQDRTLDAQESRKRIADAVARRYTALAAHALE